METLNFLSALPAAIVAPIGFVGFPSLAPAVPFRRNLLPANIHPKPASMASASSCFFLVLICRDCVRRTRWKGAGRRRKKSHRRLQSLPPPLPQKKKSFATFFFFGPTAEKISCASWRSTSETPSFFFSLRPVFCLYALRNAIGISRRERQAEVE